MRESSRLGTVGKSLACALTMLMLITSSIGLLASGEETRGEHTLYVATHTDIPTKNVLSASDIWSRNVLFPVYSTVGLTHPDTQDPLPYILKGIDADDSGVFDADEYGVFAKGASSDQLNVTAYYDFNGVHFHDGVQATIEDLLFSYHVDALRPFSHTYLDVLKDKSNLEGVESLLYPLVVGVPN